MLQNPRTKGPGEAPKEALERHLKEAKHPLRLTLRNFTLGEAYLIDGILRNSAASSLVRAVFCSLKRIMVAFVVMGLSALSSRSFAKYMPT